MSRLARMGSSVESRDGADTAAGGSPKGPACFVTTRWTVVLRAGATDTTQARDALAALCRAYWYPLYAYVRQRGAAPADAQDLTQEFFARLLENHSLAALTREGGRFRSFLLKAMNHFLVDEWRKARAQKRGGGQVVSLDAGDAETRFGREPAHHVTPELLYEQNWALALLDTVFARLRREQELDGKASLFAELKFCLTGERSALPYAELARRLEMPENTVKTQVRRLRQRYRELLRDEVAQTVASPAEIEEELRHLFRALAGPA